MWHILFKKHKHNMTFKVGDIVTVKHIEWKNPTSPTHLILKHSILRIDDDAYVTSPIENVNIPVTECWFNKKTLRSTIMVNGDILEPTIKKISHLTHQLPVRYAIILTV